MLPGALLLLFLQASPAREGLFVMQLDGLSVGTVGYVLGPDAGTFDYRATHFYRDGPRGFTSRLSGWAPDCPPELLVLDGPPAVGCRCALEERTRKRERLCVEEVRRGLVRGRLDAEPFQARHTDGGALAWMEVGGMAFRRAGPDVALPEPGVDPFAQPFRVSGEGPVVALEPGFAGVEVLVHAPRAVGPVTVEGGCLEVARALLGAGRRRGTVQLGLRVSGAEAVPHAWTRLPGGEEVDGSYAPEDPTATYVRFPAGEAGRLYLELLSRRRAVVRRRPEPPRRPVEPPASPPVGPR